MVYQASSSSCPVCSLMEHIPRSHSKSKTEKIKRELCPDCEKLEQTANRCSYGQSQILGGLGKSKRRGAGNFGGPEFELGANGMISLLKKQVYMK